MEIQDKTVVSLRFRMKNSKGEVLEDILDGPPINYLHGGGNILPLLEAALTGLKATDQKLILISKNEGYEGMDDNFSIEVVVDDVRPATEKEIEKGLVPLVSDSCGPEGCC